MSRAYVLISEKYVLQLNCTYLALFNDGVIG